MSDNIDPKTWDEFIETGLFLFVNSFLHIFGWAIVVEYDGDINNRSVKKAYPARTKFRGFSEGKVEDAYLRTAEYLKQNSAKLLDEIKETG
ncbi:hypothetical protein JWG40_03700 [Leptospira sp. 201903074]|uniref:hypothetical protein n=1 Tax=Leptospira abararensis TaxID=2810036 RepID=UPI0019645B4D|nr:hypothetical protein [Leptospira abararensis]MBM9546104.1 hypothetical protein [Leptospira abararensis]